MARGDGQMVSVLAFYAADPSLNPADDYSFYSVKLCEKNEKTVKRPGLTNSDCQKISLFT